MAIIDPQTELNCDLLELFNHTFDSLEVPYSVHIGSTTLYPHNNTLLIENGYAEMFNDPLLLCREPLTIQPLNPAVMIRAVSGTADEHAYCRVVAEGFELPSSIDDLFEVMLHFSESLHVVAWLDGTPVGAGTVVCCNGVAGIYNVATLPIVRRQGIATAVMVTLHQYALANGYDGTALASSEMGLSLYQALGYRLEGYQLGYARTDPVSR